MGGVAGAITGIADTIAAPLGGRGSLVGRGVSDFLTMGAAEVTDQNHGFKNLTDGLSAKNSYRAQNPLDPGTYAEQIAAGQQNFNQNQANQQLLAQQLMSQTKGEGPNPAQIMLQNASNKNAATAAGQIASQKGINPGLAQRTIAQSNANIGQQAAGQGALMGAEQQIAAQHNLAGLYGQQGGQNLQNQQLLNDALLKSTLGTQGINANIEAQNTAGQNQLWGSVLGAGGSLLGAGLSGRGGGGSAGVQQASNYGDMGGQSNLDVSGYAAHGGYIPGYAAHGGDSYANDTVPTMLSPGEIVIPRTKAKDPDSAKEFIDHLMKSKGKKR